MTGNNEVKCWNKNDAQSIVREGQKQSENIEFVNICKVIACILVVYVHGANIYGYAGVEREKLLDVFLISSLCGVPIFFCISGYLLFRKKFKWKENMRRKCRSLLIPYFLWMLFYIILYTVGHGILPVAFENIWEWGWIEVLENIIGVPFYTASKLYGPLWFVRDLFLMNIVASGLYWLLSKWPRIMFVISLIIWFIPVRFNCYYMRNAVTFFIIGGLIGIYPIILEKIKALNVRVVCGGVLFGILVYFSENEYIERLGVLLFVVLVFWMSMKIKKFGKYYQLISIILPHCFIVYVLHGKILSILQVLCISLFPRNIGLLMLEYLGLPTVVIFVCVGCSVVYRNVLPRLYKISTGGR